MMTYKLRVSLPNIKGFARIYAVKETDTLFHFHKQMVSDMEFQRNQTVLFKGLNAKGDVVARYASFDLGFGSIDCISLKKACEAGIVKFIYFYDTINKLSVEISFEGKADVDVSSPTLIESKGPNPIEFLNGYVAFEDLSPEKQRNYGHPYEADNDTDEDDLTDEEDEVEEDESDEDFKEVYSENE